MTQLDQRARPRGPAEQGGGRSLLLAAAGLLLGLHIWPWGLAGLGLEVAAVVVGAWALRRARQHGGPAPGAVAGVVVATLSGLFLAGCLGVVAVFHDEVTAYQRCRDRAITHAAQAQCEPMFQRAATARLSDLLGVDLTR